MEATKQLLNSGILEGNFEDNVDTSWIFNQVHSVQDQSHIKTWHGGHLPKLDNQSTIDVFVNWWILKNIQ